MKQIQEEADRKNTNTLNELDDLFKRTEAMLSKIEKDPDEYSSFNGGLIDTLMDMIYRSTIKSTVNSTYNSYLKHKTLNMDTYDTVRPLLDKWRDILDVGSNLNEQSLDEFIEDLNEFTIENPEFTFDFNYNNDTWTFPRFFEEIVWKQYFKEGADKARVLCDKMRKILESRGDKIELLINSGYSLIDPFQFEELIATLFNKLGYETEVTAKTCDFGIDIIAKKEKVIIAIQTKKYAKGNNVGNRDVQRLLGAMQQRRVKANKAILITTSDFTVQAMEQAEETPIELWDGSYISSLLRKYMRDPLQKAEASK